MELLNKTPAGQHRVQKYFIKLQSECIYLTVTNVREQKPAPKTVSFSLRFRASPPKAPESNYTLLLEGVRTEQIRS
jgi:hypothetical protein